MTGPSLRRNLISRLLAWQLAALLALAVSSVFIFYFLDDYTGARFDRDIADILAESVAVQGDGLVVRQTDDMATMLERSPDLWFIMEDQAGRRVTGGAVPDRIVPLLDDLNDFTSIEIMSATPTAMDVLLSDEDTTIGDVQVVFGGGRQPSWIAGLLSFAGREVSPLLAVMLAMIGGLTVFVVPRVVAASFGSLQAVEDVASGIDIDKRGVRLPSAAVPAEVAALVNAVNAALSRLDDGYAQKQRFLADAAHELRTPIAILQSRLELTPRKELDTRLLVDVHRLANLAEQLLDLQRIEGRNGPAQPVDLVPLARQVIADLAPLAITAGYDPVFDSALDSLVVPGDAGALERALVNLVQNAITHGGGSGEIVLSIAADRTIAISDSGPGIPEDRRDWIFEPFHRIKPLNEGSGLGLSLVREIVQRHGGTISAGESPTGGAKFLLRFA